MTPADQSVQERWLRFGDHVPGKRQERTGRAKRPETQHQRRPRHLCDPRHQPAVPCRKNATPEMGFCTRVAQRSYHSHIMARRLDPSVCHKTLCSYIFSSTSFMKMMSINSAVRMFIRPSVSQDKEIPICRQCRN